MDVLTHTMLYRTSAVLLLLGLLGHTLGGMLRMSRQGPSAGAEADDVLSRMKAVRFRWRGSDANTWFNFWMGNGLGVSALLVLAVVVLWTLGEANAAELRALGGLGAAASLSLAMLAFIGFRYFVPMIGITFSLIALISVVALWRALVP